MSCEHLLNDNNKKTIQIIKKFYNPLLRCGCRLMSKASGPPRRGSNTTLRLKEYKDNYQRGLYVELGPRFYSSYEGPVYDILPIRLTESVDKLCSGCYQVGTGKTEIQEIWEIYCCTCHPHISFLNRSTGETRILKDEPLGCPIMIVPEEGALYTNGCDNPGDTLYGSCGCTYGKKPRKCTGQGVTLRLPHPRGNKTTPTQDIPKVGDCNDVDTSGIYLKVGGIMYRDYQGLVYHRLPKEQCLKVKGDHRPIIKLGKVFATDGKVYKVGIRDTTEVIAWRKNLLGIQTYYRWNTEPLGIPIWVKTCSDPNNKNTKPQDDRLKKGGLNCRPKEQEPDIKKKPGPDAVIVSEGKKYHVTCKGKVKGEKTKEGIYHKKTKPQDSRKKLEKALLAWAILALLTGLASSNITQWNLADEFSQDMHRAMFERNISRSIHGIWPMEICKGVPTPMITDQQAKQIVGMVDASPSTNYTCCHLQRHEWNKHGWCNWYHVEPWVTMMIYYNQRIVKQIGQECAVTCRYNHTMGINIVLQARSSPASTTGCKPGVSYSFAGEVRKSKCKLTVNIEELIESLHSDWQRHTLSWEDYFIDGATHLIEGKRQLITGFIDKIENGLDKAKQKLTKLKKFFASSSSPSDVKHKLYCDKYHVLGDYVYVNSCLPMGLPTGARFISKNLISLEPEKSTQIIPRLTHHLDSGVLLTLVAMSDFMPETSSALYLILHFLIPNTRHRTISEKGLIMAINITSTESTSSVIPTSVYVNGEWVCWKPSWWPYSADIALFFEGAFEFLELMARAVQDLLRAWSEATAVAFLCFLIKAFRGQVLQGVILLLLLSSAEARYNQVQVNKPDWHTIRQKDLKGVLSGKNGVYILRSNKVSTGDAIIVTDEFAVTTFQGDHTGQYKFSVRVLTTPVEMDYCIKVLDTAKFFCTIVGSATQKNLVKPPKMYCGCGNLEIQDYNSTGLIPHGNILESKCLNGWTGVVTCHCPYTDIRMKFLENNQPQKYSKNCPGTYVSSQNFHHDCTYGSQDNCVEPRPTMLPTEAYEDIQDCFWCSYYFKNGNFSPHEGPLGWCRVDENEPYYLTKRKSCNQGGVQIGGGEIECLIGETKIKVGNLNETVISPMPCFPIKDSSQGPPSRTTCTYKYAKVLKNKFYDEKDKYWGQYMIKDGYQYWFDLEQSDHFSGGLLKYLPLLMVLLLGGKLVAWLLTAYYLMEVVEASVTYAGQTAVVIGPLIKCVDLDSMCILALIFLMIKGGLGRLIVISVYSVLKGKFLIPFLLALSALIRSSAAQECESKDVEAQQTFPVVCVIIYCIVAFIRYGDAAGVVVLILLGVMRTMQTGDNSLTLVLLLCWIAVGVIIYLAVRKHHFSPIVTSVIALVLTAQLAGLVTNTVRRMGVVVMGIYPVEFSFIHKLFLVYIFYLAYIVTYKKEGTDFFTYILDLLLIVKIYLVVSLDCVSFFLSNFCSDIVRYRMITKKLGTSLTEERLSLNTDIEALEKKGSYIRPYSRNTKILESREVTYILARALLLTALGRLWFPFVFIDLFLSVVLSAHKQLLREVASSKSLLATVITAMTNVIIIIKYPGITKTEKLYQTWSTIKREILKHEIQNVVIRNWYEDTESMHRGIMAFVVKVVGRDSILCANCEQKNIYPCPACGAESPRIRCGWTLKDLEYTKLNSTEKCQTGGIYKFKRTNIEIDYGTITHSMKKYIQMLPILATRQNLILVGNLGYEVETLVKAGWRLRAPAIIPKIVEMQQGENSILDKLQLFFGITPMGATPKNPTRLPTSLLKIKRGFETGWAYTHPGGLSSVEHVTGKNDIFCSDINGRTIIKVTTSNSKTDETEFGIKTDMNTTEGARCIAFNPEATNISGSRGAVVHLRKCGSEFKCVTADGTPAYYNLNNLKGWSGLPIFDLGTGKIVGRVKAGSNLAEGNTEIIGGTTSVLPESCDLETIVKQIQKMDRGMFLNVTLATGAGKTTELPRRLMEKIGTHKRVLVLIPLRAAAIGVHKYMQVKYPHINFNLRVGDLKEGDMSTGITYASYGYMCQMEMPKIREMAATYNYIFLDEYHCATPEQLAIIAKIHRVAETVRVVAMTATPVGVVASKGQKHDIKEEELAEVLKGENLGDSYHNVAGLKVGKNILKDNTLVFVATRKQAEEVAKKLKTEGVNAGFYYSGMEPESINRTTAREPYCIVATNAIESGVTLPNLTNVIDTCLKCEKRVRIQTRAPYIITGLKKIVITPGEAAQRRGRVGRTKPGNYYKAPIAVQGEQDYHYNLLQAQLYGLPDGINITAQFRKMNNEWALYEEDKVLLTQLEVCNNYLLSDDLPQLTKNILARTTHPEKIQLAYNCFETPVPIIFPEVKNGEVTSTYPDYNLVSYKVLKDQAPFGFYSTEDEDLALDLMNMEWQAPNLEQTIETGKALEKMAKLSKLETALVGGLITYVGYKALEKRHKPFVEAIYTYQLEQVEDLVLCQVCPDDIVPKLVEENIKLNQNLIDEKLIKIKEWIKDLNCFTQMTTDRTNFKMSVSDNILEYWEKLKEYLYKNEKEITKYGGWGLHTAFHNSISARLGSEVATALVIIKWMAFGGSQVEDYVKQAAVDVVVYYVINTPKFDGDEETASKGRKYVATVLISAMAKYIYTNGYGDLHTMLEPLLSYLPYATSLLQWFRPNQMENVVVTGHLIYKLFLSVKTGSNKGLVGLSISSGMELYSMNPITLCVALILGVGAIAAHTILEQSENKRTLLMKVFVKNFLDQAATDELCKSDPETIISAVFETLHTASNPIRTIFHLYMHFHKKLDVKKIVQMTAGKNILVLVVLECLEIMELDKESKLKMLSSNYILDWIKNYLKKLERITTNHIINKLIPAPFSCTVYKPSYRVKLIGQENCTRAEHRCTCGSETIVFNNGNKWKVIQRKGSFWCRNNSVERILSDLQNTDFYDEHNNMLTVEVDKSSIVRYQKNGKVVALEDQGETLVATSTATINYRDLVDLLDNRVDGFAIADFHRGYIEKTEMFERGEAYFLDGIVYFFRIERCQAATRLLTKDNIKKIISTINKRQLKPEQTPREFLINWYSEQLITDCHRTIKPSFGERLLCMGDKTHKEHHLGNDTNEEEPDIWFLAPDELSVKEGTHRVGGQLIKVEKVQTRSNEIKIGYEESNIPGKEKRALTRSMVHCKAEREKKIVFILGNPRLMSATAKHLLRKFVVIYPERLGEVNGPGISIYIGEEKFGLFDIETKFLKSKQLRGTLIEREHNLSLDEFKSTKHEVFHVPEYFLADTPVFVTEEQNSENIYHHIGEKPNLLQWLKTKGYNVMTKEKTGFKVKLSWDGQKELIRTLEPLVREQLLNTKIQKLKNCHYISTKEFSNGGWRPLAASTFYGKIPCKRERSMTPIQSYLALRQLKNLDANKSDKIGYKNLQGKEWLLKKLKEPPRLGLKHLANPGGLSRGATRNKYNYNVYNKKICSLLQDIGVNISKLPTVRAQCSTSDTHDSIRAKIDKEPNEQHPDLHDDLFKIFLYNIEKKYQNSFEEVSWETLEPGLNKKGAPGFLEGITKLGDYLTPEGKKQIERLVNTMLKGKIPQYYETAIPKNEKRDVTEDLLELGEWPEKKPRIIQYPEAKMRIAITKIMFNWVKQQPLVIPGYEGKTPIFNIFNKVKKEWDQYQKPTIISFDTKAWDTQVTPKDLDLVARIQKWLYKKKYHKFIDSLTEEMKEVAVITEDGQVYIRKGQRGSGQPDTSAGNSILNVLTMAWAFCKSNGIDYKAFSKLAKIHVCGDDGFLITEESLAKNFAEEGPRLLQEAGKPQKLLTGTSMKASREFSDLEFCSHTPVKVRLSNGATTYMAGRDTAVILSKMATKLDESGIRATEEYENQVAFCFLLMYAWNPLIRRICLYIISTTTCTDPNPLAPILLQYRGDPIGAFKDVYGFDLRTIERTEMSKLSQLNLNLTIMAIWHKKTSQRMLEKCMQISSSLSPVNADRIVEKKTGLIYKPTEGHVIQGKYYEKLDLKTDKQQHKKLEGLERYKQGPSGGR